SGIRIAQEFEAAHELLVEDGDLSVAYQDVGPQLRDRRRELAEAGRPVDSVARNQRDTLAVLVGEHAPAVDLLLVDPPVTMEGRPGERRGHRDERAGNSNQRVQYPSRVNRIEAVTASALTTPHAAPRPTASPPSRSHRRR